MGMTKLFYNFYSENMFAYFIKVNDHFVILITNFVKVNDHIVILITNFVQLLN